MGELKIKISDQPFQFSADDRFFTMDLGYLSLKSSFYSLDVVILPNPVENIVLISQESLRLGFTGGGNQTFNLPSISLNNLDKYKLHIKNYNLNAVVYPAAGDLIELFNSEYYMSLLEGITLIAVDTGGGTGLWIIV